LNISKEEVEKYLSEVFSAVNAGRYQISARQKNQEIYMDYVFKEEDAIRIILSLTVYDFSDAVYNEHPRYSHEIIYIFGKNVRLLSRYGAGEETVALYIKFNKLSNNYVIVFSFHKQEYPLTYKFK